MTPKTLPRTERLPGGGIKVHQLPLCDCDVWPFGSEPDKPPYNPSYRRGPPGGVCGCCGGAIPTLKGNGH